MNSKHRERERAHSEIQEQLAAEGPPTDEDRDCDPTPEDLGYLEDPEGYQVVASLAQETDNPEPDDLVRIENKEGTSFMPLWLFQQLRKLKKT